MGRFGAFWGVQGQISRFRGLKTMCGVVLKKIFFFEKNIFLVPDGPKGLVKISGPPAPGTLVPKSPTGGFLGPIWAHQGGLRGLGATWWVLGAH